MVSPLLPLLLSAAYMGNPARNPYLDLPRDPFYLEPLVPAIPDYNPLLDFYYRPWATNIEAHVNSDSSFSSFSLDDKRLKILLDMKKFKPDEIEVNLVDNSITVSAKHEDSKDPRNKSSRRFERTFRIPASIDDAQITSEISSDGVLKIEAPVKKVVEERVKKVSVYKTGKPQGHEVSKSEEAMSNTASNSLSNAF